jgi:TPR repeat protein
MSAVGVLVGSGDARLSDARNAIEAQEYRRARKLLLRLSGEGLGEAQRELAELYWAGLGGSPDPEEALHWWTLAAEGGDWRSQMRLGTLFVNGSWVEQDPEEALRWMTQAAKSSSPAPKMQLAEWYEDGLLGRIDLRLALRWHREAAYAGDRASQYRVGEMHLRGEGTPVDLVEAYAWISAAGELASLFCDSDRALSDLRSRMKPAEVDAAEDLLAVLRTTLPPID